MAERFFFCVRPTVVAALLMGAVISSCAKPSQPNSQPNVGASPSAGLPGISATATATTTATKTATKTAIASNSDSTLALLQQSWTAYRQRFIQADGRVIDWEADERTTSEGQAYAMLRAVLIDDPETFDRTFNWAELNLRRLNANGTRSDSLWSWKWGKDENGTWVVLDKNFASDADIDATTALILAARRWNRPDYLQQARIKLRDLWTHSTVPSSVSLGGEVASAANPTAMRYLLPGPTEAFQPQPTLLYLNPSYLAPYAFRIFAQVDTDHDWLSLVQSSYAVLNESAKISTVGLPSDWVVLDLTSGRMIPLREPNPLRSLYGFDAYRVWWRVAIDAKWFNEPVAREYLQQHLAALKTLWQSNQAVPAQIDLQGQPLVTYESTAQYGMLYSAFSVTAPEIAEQIRQQKLLPTYRDGFWDNNSAYYTQNLSWFGLLSSTDVAVNWLQP